MKIFLLSFLLLFIFSCTDSDEKIGCSGVTCSNHGRCELDDFENALCICDDGYYRDGLKCLKSEEFSMRLMAANITSGNGQEYETPGINIFKALKPDIVMINEFNYAGDIDDFVDNTFGKSFSYYQGDGQIPNGIISRFNILDSGSWSDPGISNRDLDWAIVDIPGDKNLFAISVHLKAKKSAKQRAAAEVIAKEVYNHRKKNPNKYYYVVGGDFNGPAAVASGSFCKYQNEDIFDCPPDADYRCLTCPKGEDGGVGTNASRGKHYDWILTTDDLEKFQVPTKYCATETDCKVYKDGLVFDSRDYSQTELDKYFSPVKVSDSKATNMQHMAIIKDFLVK